MAARLPHAGYAPVRLLALAAAVAGLVWLAWPAASGPPTVRARPGAVLVGLDARVDLSDAIQVRPVGSDGADPTSWRGLPGFAPPTRGGPEPMWALVRLRNPTDQRFEGLLALRAPRLRGIEAFVGYAGRFDARLPVERLHRLPVVAVQVPARESRDVVLRVAGLSAGVPAELWRPDAFTDAAARADWALGIMLGLIFAVTLYHIGNALLQRERSHLPFLAVSVAWSIYAYVALGYAYAHWGTSLPRLSTDVDGFSAVALAALLWFTRSSFEVGRGQPRLAAALRGLELGVLGVGGLALAGLSIPEGFEVGLLGVCGLTMLAIAAAHWRRGSAHAQIFLVALAPFLLALYAGSEIGAAGRFGAPLFAVAAATAALALAFSVAERVARSRDRRTKALRASRERFEYAARGSNDGLFDVHLEDASRTHLSPRFFDTLRLPPEAIEPDVESLLGLVHGDERPSVQRALLNHFSNPEASTVQLEFRGNFGDGSVRWLVLRALMVRRGTRVVRLVGSITDVHDRKANELKLERRAYTDETTGLANRARVLQHLEALLEIHGEQPEVAFGVLFIDVDGFKKVNDSLGHSVGDQMLATLGRRLSLVARDEDLVGRLGGDEFVLVLAGHLEVADIERIARRVLEAFTAPVALEGLEVRPSASIGITHSDIGYDSVAKILEDADVAMFEAKRAGKARYVTFDDAMRRRVRAHFELEADLRTALEQGQIEVYYQPILDAEGPRLAGFEALLRWNHPSRGLVSPGEFIPVAEETGMIRLLGRFALFEATGQLADWQHRLQGADDWFVTVNVSPVQFGHDLQHEVLAALRTAHIEPHRLKLEITEGLYLGDSGAVKDEMKRIAADGVRFALDDFGTGYSSLSYLHDLPFSTLKVDRSFMQNLLEDPHSEAIVKSVLGLAQGLGMATVAEGVETLEVVERMAELGVTYFQGYYFGRPQPPAALEAHLRAEGYIVSVPLDVPPTVQAERRARRDIRSADRRSPERTLGLGPAEEDQSPSRR